MRDECKGCIYAGKTILCEKMDLWWELYNLTKETTILRLIVKEPAQCHGRYVEREEEQ